MNQSEQVNEIAGALAKAQGLIKGAVKDSLNPHFKSSYADLESVWEAIRGPLSANGLALVQTTHMIDGATVLRTTILHSSGQWLAGDYPIAPERPGPQALGSAITYARRYAACAAVGVTQTDDDGEAASEHRPPPPKAPPPKPAAPAQPAKKMSLVLPAKDAPPPPNSPPPPALERREPSGNGAINLGDKYAATPAQRRWLKSLGESQGVPMDGNLNFYTELSKRCAGIALSEIPAILNKMIEGE